MQEQYFNTGQVAVLLKIPYYRITYLINTGKIPKPRKMNNRYLYDEENIKEIKAILNLQDKNISHLAEINHGN